MYELYADSPFIKFSHSTCGIYLENQEEISKRFVDAIKIHHGNN